ncbi:MAG: hypothetical protein ACP5P4_15795 [Steroidobacteraceae bacterium]
MRAEPPRTEEAIRADLAQMLTAVVRRFDAQLAQDRHAHAEE